MLKFQGGGNKERAGGFREFPLKGWASLQKVAAAVEKKDISVMASIYSYNNLEFDPLHHLRVVTLQIWY